MLQLQEHGKEETRILKKRGLALNILKFSSSKLKYRFHDFKEEKREVFQVHAQGGKT